MDLAGCLKSTSGPQQRRVYQSRWRYPERNDRRSRSHKLSDVPKTPLFVLLPTFYGFFIVNDKGRYHSRWNTPNRLRLFPSKDHGTRAVSPLTKVLSSNQLVAGGDPCSLRSFEHTRRMVRPMRTEAPTHLPKLRRRILWRQWRGFCPVYIECSVRLFFRCFFLTDW
jgi:glycine/D-amino acid oxidase-like deaminating enzyme